MNIETLNQANKTMATIREIDDEIKAWTETTEPSHLGRKQHWNNGHLISLPCKHSPRAAFDAYRDACINTLKVRRAEVDVQIAALYMEIEMADAGECNKEIYEKGQYVGTVTGADSFTIDAFVKCVAESTGVRMDWHYVGGRGRVLAIGDVEKASRGLLRSALHVQV